MFGDSSFATVPFAFSQQPSDGAILATVRLQATIDAAPAVAPTLTVNATSRPASNSNGVR